MINRVVLNPIVLASCGRYSICFRFRLFIFTGYLNRWIHANLLFPLLKSKKLDLVLQSTSKLRTSQGQLVHAVVAIINCVSSI